MKEAHHEPTKDEVSVTLRVRYAETDAMGVAHHSSYIVWMEAGRTEFMRAKGFTYRELEAIGVSLPVVEITARYYLPSYYDDELVVGTHVAELTRTRILLAYRISRLSDGALLMEGTSLHTFTGRDGRPLMITHHPEAWARMQAMAPRTGNQGDDTPRP